MSLALIYARSLNYCIGRDGVLPWVLPDEYAHFNRVTMGHSIIMGRRTYQENNHALPGRLNIVITRSDDWHLPREVLRAKSLAQAISLADSKNGKTFVLGGTGLFREAYKLADEVYETVINASFDGDTFIDAFSFANWQTTTIAEHGTDAQHAAAFTVLHHKRPQRAVS